MKEFTTKKEKMRKCRKCAKVSTGIITRHKIMLCRQCFREVAEQIGFKKYN